MLLTIDAGNTNTLFAVHDGTEWRARWRAATNTQRTADEYAAWLLSLMGLSDLGFDDISGCVISSVVPQSVFHFRNLARRYLEVEPLIVGEDGLDIGVEARIDRPEEAGADRLVNTLGAHTIYGGPLLVVDSGTATTFDVVTEDGAFGGGAIAPGINLSLQALYEAAAKLPRVAIKNPGAAIGTNTVSAMQSGLFWGYIGLIDGLIARMRAEMAPQTRVIGTGGVASLFQGASEQIEIYDADITIRGLLEIWRRNRRME